MSKLIVNADDFGMSEAINRAIIDGYRQGGLTHASIFAHSDYTEDAIKLAKEQAPGLHIGLHMTLSSGFLPLLVRCAFGGRALEEQLWRAIEAQILELHMHGVTLSHIDGHRHIHMIPMIWRIVQKLAIKHHIPRIRTINESLIHTARATKDVSFLWSGGFVKYALLKTLYYWNGVRSPIYFFSILHSCRISKEMVQGFVPPQGYEQVEIMLHPSYKVEGMAGHPEEAHMRSPYRDVERETMLALKKGS